MIMKVSRHGQAALLSDAHCSKIRKQLENNPQHRLLWDVARWTGERWGAILQLQISDVFTPDGGPRPQITYRAQTRKASPTGKRITRQVPVHSTLREILLAYKLESESGYLFPSPRNKGSPLGLRAADAMLRTAIAKADLEHVGISTHSTRVTFITNLHSKGISLRVIQQLTGHQDLKVLSRYVVVSPEQARLAIATL